MTNTDKLNTLHEIPPEYYQQSTPSVPLITLITILCRHIPHQQEIGKLMKLSALKFCIHIFIQYMQLI